MTYNANQLYNELYEHFLTRRSQLLEQILTPNDGIYTDEHAFRAGQFRMVDEVLEKLRTFNFMPEEMNDNEIS